MSSIDVPKERDLKPVEIALKKGVTLEAARSVRTGRSSPISGHVSGDRRQADRRLERGQEFPDGIFRIPAPIPGRTYRVFFVQPGQKARGGRRAEGRSGSRGPDRGPPPADGDRQGKGREPRRLAARQGVQVYPQLALTADRKGTQGNGLLRRRSRTVLHNGARPAAISASTTSSTAATGSSRSSADRRSEVLRHRSRVEESVSPSMT